MNTIYIYSMFNTLVRLLLQICLLAVSIEAFVLDKVLELISVETPEPKLESYIYIYKINL